MTTYTVEEIQQKFSEWRNYFWPHVDAIQVLLDEIKRLQDEIAFLRSA